MKKLKGVVVGAGYFSDFHYDAWSRIIEVEVVALSDLDGTKASEMQEKYNIAKLYTDFEEMIRTEKPDFVDIVTPPATHFEIIKTICGYGIPMICQKPLAPTFAESEQILDLLNANNVPFMVHENFRFQPWHREIKKLLDANAIGIPHNFYFQTRMGDGHGEEAYLSRQPYFREYHRLLIYETGIHFIDTFRYLGGEISEVFARLKRLNPVINGEDTAQVQFTFENGAWGTWDANRYNEDVVPNKRYTFGTFLIEGSEGSIRLDLEGKIKIQKLGQEPQEHIYTPSKAGFAGDCCFATQEHFIKGLLEKSDFETRASDYIKSLKIQELVYQSAAENRPILVNN
jgi:D-apiose dehydrogenase